MFKFLHLILGTTFLGIMIATFFYIIHSIRKGDGALIAYSLKVSYFGDGTISFIIPIQLITANKLVFANHFTLVTPWIAIAYLAFTIIVLLWLGILLIKLLYLSKASISLTPLIIFYLLNVIVILIFVMLIHDAVTQSTWFNFLFWK